MDKRCIICGLPEHYTGIQFDSKGVCNYCNFYQENKGFLEDSERLEEIFRAKMEEAKKKAKENGSRYDCLVGFSGGKDSTYVIQQLKEKYGMRVLAFTFQNAFSTEYGKRNIENALQKMPVDHIAFTMNDEELRKAYSFSVNFMYNFCAICFHYMHYYSYLFAGKNGIPLIVNGRTKGQILQTALKKDHLEPFETSYSLLDFEHQMFHGLEEKLWNQEEISYVRDIEAEAVSYFAYHEISEEEVMDSLEKSIGWTRPKSKAGGHPDCYAHAVAENMSIKKRGFPIRQGELSVEVRRGKMSVEEMMRILEQDTVHFTHIPEDEKRRFEDRIRKK
ncbi:hypothetical protein V1226_00880 [Lachnospiraceae bacterium JLR.KK009]|nr:hypothetical protein C810_04770 [Lachnospiraceae bacterium A2]